MKLERFKQVLMNGGVPSLVSRSDAAELLADIDAEIAKARGEHHKGSAWALMVVRRLEALERGERLGVASDMAQNGRLSALEASEVNLRGYAQCTPTMSVLNTLAERVKALEAAPHVEATPLGEKQSETTDENDAYNAWRLEPWPDGFGFKGAGIQNEYAFRAGFRAGRK